MNSFMKYVDKKLVISMLVVMILGALITMALRRSSNARAQELANNL
jgi:hypothetical protein